MARGVAIPKEKMRLLERVVTANRAAPMPLHVQIRRGLQRVIGEYFKEGERFYDESFVGEQLGVSVGTVRRAMMELAEEGLLERRVAMGTFVRKPQAEAARPFSVGVFVPDFADSARMRTLQALADACAAEGAGLRVYCTHGGLRTAEASELVDGDPEGETFVLLDNGREATMTLVNALEAHGFHAAEMAPGDDAAAVLKRLRAAE